jgi:predicted amidohydrolase YtcJ
VTPQIILFNGRVATRTSRHPAAQALAVGGGRILAVGDDASILAMAGPGTEKTDLCGRLVLPGFIDTHIHFYEWALKRQGVKLSDLDGIQALLERLGQAAAGRPTGQWIMGQGWNETDWTEARMPTRSILDRAAPDHPVLLWRCDLHLAAANSAALKLAGIDAATPDPPEGRIERDDRGEPTGILRELAINKVRAAVAPPDMDQVIRAFQEGTAALHRRGVTAIHDVRLMADPDGASALRAFQRLEQDRTLALRTWVTLPGERLDDIVALGLQTGFGNARLRMGHVKFFADGGMGARTAWMIDPFLDAGHGMPLMDMGDLAQRVAKAEKAGLAAMVHAVGDRANQELVNLFTTLAAQRTRSGRPGPPIAHRIEHAQMIRPEDADRLRGLDVALCVTPANMILDINLIDAAVGAHGQHTYAFRRLLDTGAPVMFSSDCPVCDPDPLAGMHAAVTRQRVDGTPVGGWYPQQRVSVSEAVAAYTATPATVHRALDLGAITAGKRADLVVLSEDILTLPPSRLPEVKVEMTLFDGKIVFRAF